MAIYEVIINTTQKKNRELQMLNEFGSYTDAHKIELLANDILTYGLVDRIIRYDIGNEVVLWIILKYQSPVLKEVFEKEITNLNKTIEKKVSIALFDLSDKDVMSRLEREMPGYKRTYQKV